jgi:hypothetical protein
MYESKHTRPITRKQFVIRLSKNVILAVLILAFSLLIGTIGYHNCGDLSWIDAFYNASLILTGMGPVSVLTSNGAKLFASFYAIYSGVAFLSVSAIILVPVFHRVLHKFHFKIEN